MNSGLKSLVYRNITVHTKQFLGRSIKTLGRKDVKNSGTLHTALKPIESEGNSCCCFTHLPRGGSTSELEHKVSKLVKAIVDMLIVTRNLIQCKEVTQGYLSDVSATLYMLVPGLGKNMEGTDDGNRDNVLQRVHKTLLFQEPWNWGWEYKLAIHTVS